MTSDPRGNPSAPSLWREISGGCGDLGTFLPLAVGASIACGLDFGFVLVAAGAMNVVTGLVFRVPLPVQPMKALAVAALAGGLGAGSLAAAGIAMGALLLVLGVSGAARSLAARVPRPVVRAIQFGLGVLLALEGLRRLQALDPWAVDGFVLAAVVVVALVVADRFRWPGALAVFLAGMVVAAITHPEAMRAISWWSLQPHWIVPSGDEWRLGWTAGVLPQLPLTLINSVLAIAALTVDLFPDRAVSPRQMATSVGLMNLVAVPFGAMPMCHGSGGLAAQVRFGARSGLSVVVLGIAKIALGVALGASALPLLRAYPIAVLAPLLVFAGVHLASFGWRFERREERATVLAGAAAMVLGSVPLGVVVAIAVHAGLAAWRRHATLPARTATAAAP